LSLVDNKVLMDLAIPEGDVIWLKQEAPTWWTSGDAKHKQVSHHELGLEPELKSF
jgi:hypothetical protein